MKVAVQINGKLRQVVEVPKDIEEADIKEIIFTDEKIQEYVDGKEIVREIYVKNKIYNIVIK